MTSPRRPFPLRIWDALASLEVTIVSMVLLMALVVLCTLAQKNLGTHGAVALYMRSWFVMWHPPGGLFPLPTFPGGALVGLVLTVNLTVALIQRFDGNWSKAGLWAVHAGLILLVAGEFCTGAFQREMSMSIDEGQTVNTLEDYRDLELVVTDVTTPGQEIVYKVPARALARHLGGRPISLPDTALTLGVKTYLVNSEVRPLGPGETALADQGVGSSVHVEALAPVGNDNEMNNTSVVVEPMAGGRTCGRWLATNAPGVPPQAFVLEGRTYVLSMSRIQVTLPYSLTLKKFHHDVYPGTDIPKNFSSLVELSNPATGERREVLIFMNQPLRYLGRTFYQASFGKGDTQTILQVVQNPAWQLPYLSCTVITLGLLLHFGLSLARFFRSQARREVQP